MLIQRSSPNPSSRTDTALRSSSAVTAPAHLQLLPDQLLYPLFAKRGFEAECGAWLPRERRASGDWRLRRLEGEPNPGALISGVM